MTSGRGPKADAIPHSTICTRLRLFGYERIVSSGLLSDQTAPLFILHLADGSLRLNGKSATILDCKERSIRWTDGALPATIYEMEVSADGLVGAGTAQTAETAPQAFVATAIPPSKYQTQITKTRYPAGTSPDSVPDAEWDTGTILTVGFKCEKGQRLPVQRVMLGSSDISADVSLTVNKGDFLVLGLELEPSDCIFDPSLYLTGSIVFSTFGETFSGTLSTTCQSQSGSGELLWKGQAADETMQAIAEIIDRHSVHTDGTQRRNQ